MGKHVFKQGGMIKVWLSVHGGGSELLTGWDETNFLGRDRDQEIRLMKIHYETETEKKWMLIF